MAAPENLTPQDLNELQAYINAMKELEAVEPEYLPLESADWPGQEWEAWNKKCVDLNNEYHDVIVKALLQFLRLGDTWEDSPQSVALILDALVMGNQPKEQSEGQISLFPEDEREQALKADILQALPRLQSIILQKHIIPNNKLANSMTKNIIDAGRVILDVSSSSAKRSIDVICNLVYEGENVKLSGRQSFTEYDRNVYNAVTSLYVYGGKSHVVTPQTVYRAMVGMTDTEDPSPQQIGAVTKSLDKMRFIRATVDCTEELNRRNISLNGEYVTNGIIDTYLLNASAIQVQAGGRIVRGYLIERTPILYAYSNALNEVFTIPSEMLDIKAIDAKGNITQSRISNTESRIQVKGYLIRRIEGMKGKNALKNKTISLQSYEKGGEHHRGLYEIAGLSERATRKDKKAVRDYAAQALEYWTARGYIKGFSFLSTGKAITGIKIDP